MQTILDNGTGADALWQNQIYEIAAGGDFWQSGGDVTPGSSSTDIEMSVSAVTVNIGGESVSHGSQPVTLSSPSSNPRCDAIFADSAGVDKVEGVELEKLPTDNQFPSIYQPAPDNGSLVGGPPLAAVFVEPEDSVSSDIESWQIQDRRMNGDLVTPADHVAAIEGYDTGANGPVETTTRNAARLDDQPAGRIRRNYFSMSVPGEHKPVPGTQASGDNYFEKRVTLPPDHRFRLWRVSLASDGADPPSTLRARVVRLSTEGYLYNRPDESAYDTDGLGPVFNSAATFGRTDTQEQLAFRVTNTADVSESADGFVATFWCEIEDAARDP
jgi:hypothetical protein